MDLSKAPEGTPIPVADAVQSPASVQAATEPAWHVPGAAEINLPTARSPATSPIGDFAPPQGWASGITTAIAAGAAQEVLQRAKTRVQTHSGFFSVATIANRSRPLFDVNSSLVINRLTCVTSGRPIIFGPNSPPDLYGPLVGLHLAFICQFVSIRSRGKQYSGNRNVILSAMGGLISYWAFLSFAIYAALFFGSNGVVSLLPILSAVGYAVVPLTFALLADTLALGSLGTLIAFGIGVLTALSLGRTLRSVAYGLHYVFPLLCCSPINLKP